MFYYVNTVQNITYSHDNYGSDVEESNDASGGSGVNSGGSVAAASSTAGYCERYVSYNDDVIDLLNNDLALYSTLQNATDIDDDDYVDIDSDSEDKACTSFPKNKKPPMNLIIGRPQPEDTTGMTAVEAQLTKEADQTVRKQWSDKRRLQRLKKNKVRSPPCASPGIIDETLRTMVDVEANCLSVGHTFPIKDI